MTKIYDNIPVPTNARAGRPTIADFGALGHGQCLFVELGEDEPAKKVEKVRGAIARWRKADAARAAIKFTVALADIPEDPMGAKGVGVWRTA